MSKQTLAVVSSQKIWQEQEDLHTQEKRTPAPLNARKLDVRKLAELFPSVPADKLHTLGNDLRAFFHVNKHKNATISPSLMDYLIGQIDEILSAQINVILQAEPLKSLEKTWRNLYFLVSRVDFTQNIFVEFISVSKNDLLHDFQDVPSIIKSGLYYHIYTSEFGQFGGTPVAAVIADYTITHSQNDLQLLQYVSSVAAMAHAPFFAAAGMEFFDIGSWGELSNIMDLNSLFDMPRYAKWNSFRNNPNARYIGLTLPGFLLRLPYHESQGELSTSFDFVEDVSCEENFCWGNTAFALAVLLADSFAKYRWCVNIIGPDGGGSIDNLLCSEHHALQGLKQKVATRSLITEKREFELANLGFIPMSIHKNPHEAVFFSANSVLRAKQFPSTQEGAAEQISFKLSTQFPYMMLINRLAHYIKVLQRENTGLWRERHDLSRELNGWINQYVTAMDTPDAVTRSKRPLRMAEIVVQDVEGSSGWYSIAVHVKPHFKYMGVNFTLSLEGKLERNTVPVEM